MTLDEAKQIDAWIQTLPPLERATLLAQLREAIRTGRLPAHAGVRVRVQDDGTYALILPPEPSQEGGPG